LLTSANICWKIFFPWEADFGDGELSNGDSIIVMVPEGFTCMRISLSPNPEKGQARHQVEMLRWF
jgi:hypothetical protein